MYANQTVTSTLYIRALDFPEVTWGAKMHPPPPHREKRSS